MRKEVIIAFTVGLLCMLELCATTEVASLDDVEVSPYLLLATVVRIYRINLDGSGLEVLVHERNFGILGVEYHYRLNSLFWTNVLDPSIKQANLDGSNIRTIVTNGPGDLELLYPVDLALDWINDKLYWTDRDAKKIGVYDLVTAERRVILSTGGTNSLPFGLAVYPFPGYGWLYWVDRGKSTLEVVAVTGEGREVLESGRRVGCAWPLTLDYSEHTAYWINYCDSRMLSINMDGSQSSQSVHVTNIVFAYGISIFNNTIFWTQEQSAYSVDILQRKQVTHILGTLDGGARGIATVHPMQQPTAEVFRMIVDTGTAVCDPPCANGVCIDPGLCYCGRGWTGPDCLKDMNECDAANGDCQQRCVNTPGSYECVCFDGFALNETMTCEDVNECEISNGGCDHNCTNSEGSYECSCVADLVLGADGRSCGCIEGYVTKDNITCEDFDECSVSNGGCQHNCTNSEGSYECSCLPPFVLSLDDRSCEDVNECNISNGGCAHNCINLEGSYECSCPEGFVLDNDGRSCNVKGVMEIATSPTHNIIPTLTSVATTPSDEVLETSRLHTSAAANITSSFVNIPQHSSIPSPVKATRPIPPPSSNENTRLDTTVAAIMSSFVNIPQNSSILSPLKTTQPIPPPSSNENTVLSSSSTREINSFAPLHISTTVPALRPLPTTTSNMQMLPNTVFVGTAIPTTSSTTEASDTSSKSRTIPSSTSTTHTSPSTSMGSSPSPDIAEPEPSSSTELVIIAAAASAGVIAVAVVMVIIAIIAYRWRAHKSGSWSPPRSTGDSPTDSIKYTTSTVTTASTVDSNGTL